MSLIITTERILFQLISFLKQTHSEQYSRKISELSNASIGQHTRHVIEFFECLLSGSDKGVVNYDKRNHNKELEENKEKALVQIENIISSLKLKNLDQELELECNYEISSSKDISVKTIFGRELIYNIEHAVHHMAIIKIGASIIASDIKLPEDFGVAASTIRYKSKDVYSHLSA